MLRDVNKGFKGSGVAGRERPTLNIEHPTLKRVLTGRLMLKHKLNAAGDRSSKFDVERSMFNVK
jgi:hypothetical protein